jgi:fibronectin type 3 domain-containing protein
VPNNYLKIDTGYVFVGVEDKRELPKPVKLAAKPGDKVVMLSWPKIYYEDIYIAYKVERSLDGTVFKEVTKLPVINTESGKNLRSDLIYKLDSLEQNNVRHFYRIKGLTSFGDTGPPSDVVSTMGVKTFDATPAISKIKVDDNTKVLLKWDFPSSAADELKGFNILRSTEADNNFMIINKELVKPDVSTYVDEQPRATNYYRVQALGKHDQVSVSFPNLVQLEDSIPPVSPQGLKASVSNDGAITLSWSANTENDLIGYRVFRSNYKSEEYSQVTTSPSKQNLFVDTVSIKTLSDKVYYKITAVDQRFNSSTFSEMLEVNRPDIIPPIPALFKKYSIKPEGVLLEWTASPSTDITKYEIWRSDKAQKLMMFLKEYQPGDSVRTFLDITASAGVLYQYILYTFDDAGFKISNPQLFQVKVPLPAFVAAPENVVASVDRVNKFIQLTWQFNLPQVEKYLIYRAKGEEPITLHKRHNAAGLYEDRDLEMNTTYRYRVQAIMTNGVQSKLSEEITVTF